MQEGESLCINFAAAFIISIPPSAFAATAARCNFCGAGEAIGVAFGATVSRAPELLHGKISLVHHTSSGVLENLPTPFTATRYHSLAIEAGTLPQEVEIIGSTESGIVMAIKHKSLPISGVQFHPESVLTEHGHQMLGNWLEECGDKGARARSEGLTPVVNR